MTLQNFFKNQRWWGKLMGAFFGFLMAGPAGAVLGILAGNFFDKGLAQHFNRPHWNYHAEKNKAIQQLFFEAIFSVMGYIAKSAGRVSEKDIAMAKTIMAELGLKRELTARAKKYFNEGKSITFDIEKCLSQLQIACLGNPTLLRLFIDIQYRATFANGYYKERVQALNQVLKQLGYATLNEQHRFYQDFGYQFNDERQKTYQSSQNHQKYRQQHSPPNRFGSQSIQRAYALLEVSMSANKQEVKRAYRRLMSKNHPDKLMSQNVPESKIKMANEKTQAISQAYDLICQFKGW